MANYYAILKKVWDELINYEQILVCDCKDVTMVLTKRYEKEKLLQFLIGLNTEIFGTIRSSILNKNPLLMVNQAYSKVSQEEKIKQMTKGEEERDARNIVVFSVVEIKGNQKN